MGEQLKQGEPMACLRCRGAMFQAQVPEAGYFSFALHPLKRKWWDTNAYSKAAAWVCQACGYVELHAVDIAAIYPKPEK